MWSLLWRGSLIVLLPLVLLEVGSRTVLAPAFEGTYRLLDFYLEPEAVADTADVDYIFLGTSRVAAAVHQAHFDSLAEARFGGEALSLNIGKGSALPATQYYGLRRMETRHPGTLDGTVVFLGAPHGVPDQLWAERWTNDAWPLLLSPFLPNEDVPRFFRTAAEPLSQKVHITLARHSHALRYWPSVQQRLMATAQGIGGRFGLPVARPDVEKINQQVFADQHTVDADTAEVDLVTQGGIRADSMGIDANRRYAMQLYTQYLEQTLPTRQEPIDWEGSVLAELVRFVREAGGEVAVFNVPLTTTDSLYYQYTQGEGARAGLEAWAARHDVPLLQVGLRTTDEDYPDFRHLRASLGGLYTERLFNEYVEHVDRPLAAGD